MNSANIVALIMSKACLMDMSSEDKGHFVPSYCRTTLCHFGTWVAGLFGSYAVFLAMKKMRPSVQFFRLVNFSCRLRTAWTAS